MHESGQTLKKVRLWLSRCGRDYVEEHGGPESKQTEDSTAIGRILPPASGSSFVISSPRGEICKWLGRPVSNGEINELKTFRSTLEGEIRDTYADDSVCLCASNPTCRGSACPQNLIGRQCYLGETDTINGTNLRNSSNHIGNHQLGLRFGKYILGGRRGENSVDYGKHGGQPPKTFLSRTENSPEARAIVKFCGTQEFPPAQVVNCSSLDSSWAWSIR